MEMRIRLSSSGEFVEEEFYEEIEAPKFVDLTLKDPYCPDDRYWFCSRVGCDEKHLEEINSEEVYKKFVLRVMAARSPNVISRKNASEYKKYPLSAPPKHSKPRVPKLAVISSISRKLFDYKDKGLSVNTQAQPPNTCSTPKQRAKQVAAKYMTTPRRVTKPRFDHSTFISARNPSRTVVDCDRLPNTASPSAVRSLSFNLQKKPITPKTTPTVGDHKTPVTKLCERMKKLELSSQRKVQPTISSSSKKNIKTEHHLSHSKDLKFDKDKGNSRIKKQVRFVLCEDDHSQSNKDTPFEAAESAVVCPEQALRLESPNAGLVGNHNEEPTCNTDEDKENAPASEVCNNNNNNGNIGITNIKVLKTAVKKQVVAVKYKKPKLTNPKPFRLRTDERGILKEATRVKKAKNYPHQKASEDLKTLEVEGHLMKKSNRTDQLNSQRYLSLASTRTRSKSGVALQEKGPARIPFAQKYVQKP